MPASIENLLRIMRALRAPDTGCPWDREQTFGSLVEHTLEEAYEVADVIERGALPRLPDELGDLLFQVVFYSQLGAELGLFDFAEVVRCLQDKLLRRHPHVFDNGAVENAAAQTVQWEAIKANERQQSGGSEPASELNGIAQALPALSRARKLQGRAARVGFDWSETAPIVAKIHEEIGELTDAIAAGQPAAARDEEFGDLLFACVNLGRHLEIDPEGALRRANLKFERRFRYIETSLKASGLSCRDASLAAMEALWNEAKANGL